MPPRGPRNSRPVPRSQTFQTIQTYRTSNLAAQNELEENHRRWYRGVKCGVIFLLTSDLLLSPAAIIVTLWYPGISFASALTTLFTGALLSYISARKVKLDSCASCWARAKFIITFTSFLTSAFFGVWSILVYIRDETSAPMLYLCAASLGLFLVHYILSVTNATHIIGALSVMPLPDSGPSGLLSASTISAANGQLPTYSEMVSSGDLIRSSTMVSAARNDLPRYEDLD